MGETTKIEWCHHTFNPWRGCTKVSPGCTNCYAETLSARNPSVLGTWGPKGTRVVASESYWRQPFAWNRAAEKAGERRRVFCASLADVFEDRRDLEEPRRRLWDLIRATPHLDWLLLSKRPQNFWMLPATWKSAPQPNVWLGVSVENQEYADERIPVLLDTPAAVRFLSCEPLLGPLDLSCHGADALPIYREADTVRDVCLPRDPRLPRAAQELTRPGRGYVRHDSTLRTDGPRKGERRSFIDWCIVGGESGPGARPCDVAWVRSIVAQCKAAGVACFVKQLGAEPFDSSAVHIPVDVLFIKDRKGGDMAEWPEDLRVREFPR